jgi:hypothetical protein
MGGLSRVLGLLIGVVLLAFAGTAWADDDDDKPDVAATAASDVGSSGAVLRGTVDPNGRSTTYYFEYGLTGAYGAQTEPTSAGSSNSAKPVSATLAGLEPQTIYHFRLVAYNSKGTRRGPDRAFTTLAAPPPEPGDPPAGGPTPGEPASGSPDLAEPPTPQLGSSVLVAPGAGELFVRRPGTDAFQPLELGSELSVGTEVDARSGALVLTSALPSGATQTGRFGGGRFVIRQGRRGYIDLHLRGRFCTRSGSGARVASVASAARRKRGRRLWGSDRGGRFRTHGKHSHATVRGTRWLVVDRCDGTLTRVSAGSVVVRDKARGKRVLLEAGERYLARPRR